jgi:predicted site-specific integrase-resolvase
MSIATAETQTLPQLLGTEDIANLFGVHIETARIWARTGKLPTPVRVGKKWKWRRESILRILSPEER